MKNRPEKIDVLWFIEHSAREMDIACLGALLLARQKLRVVIKNIYLHEQEAVDKYDPKVVVTPFFYKANDNAIGTFVAKWPQAKFFNLAFEEIFYQGNEKVKSPQDDFTRHQVLHQAWGDFYLDFLEKYGVNPKNVFLNGNPVLELYLPPYRNYYPTKEVLAKKYGLSAKARWVFVPENYRWAFMPDGSIEGMSKIGGKKEEMLDMRRYCRQSLQKLLQWSNAAASEEIVVIFRPKPATSQKEVVEFFEAKVGYKAKYLHFIKGHSVREWILSSDVVISSFSTSLIEAAVAQKPVFMVEPLPLPNSFYNDWYEHVHRIKSEVDFLAATRVPAGQDQRLAGWAKKTMLSHGDPIKNLARHLGQLAAKNKDRNLPSEPSRTNYLADFLTWLNFKLKPDVHHEMDFFTEAYVRRRIKKWSRII